MDNRMHVENCKAFSNLSAEVFQEHKGQFAILVDGKVCDFFPTLSEAVRVANMQYGAGLFSIQKVEPLPVDAGFLDCADYPG